MKDASASPRVLYIISNLDRAGAQIGTCALAIELRARGCFTAVCAFRDGPLRAELEQQGVLVHILPDRRADVLALPRFVLDMRRIRRALLEVIRAHRITILQTHLLRGLDFLVLTLRQEPGVRQMYWGFHNVGWELEQDQLPRALWLLRPKRALFRILYRAAAPRVSGFIAVSDQVSDALKRDLGPLHDRIRVIPNGIATERFGRTADRAAVRRALGLDENAILGIITARLVPPKGHRWFIAQAAPLFEQFQNLRVLLVGDGRLGQELSAQALQAGLDDRILFLGARTDVPELLAASDFFILPSLWEGMSNALLEAMASGLPVIATDVSGTRQVIRHSTDGLLIPPEDGAALRDAITRILLNPARAQELARAGRERVECFTLERRADRYLDLYGAR